MPRYSALRNQYMPSPAGGDAVNTYAANGAIAVVDGVHAITKTSLAALTLAAPVAADDGLKLIIIGRTAFAHTVTITEGIGGKGASFDVITFGAVDDVVELLADNAHWVLLASQGAVIA